MEDTRESEPVCSATAQSEQGKAGFPDATLEVLLNGRPVHLDADGDVIIPSALGKLLGVGSRIAKGLAEGHEGRVTRGMSPVMHYPVTVRVERRSEMKKSKNVYF